MSKLNNKGFAVASVLYSIMVLFLLLLLSILGILGSRKAILDKNKKDILKELNADYATNSFNFKHRDITIINRGNKDDIMFALMDGVTAFDANGTLVNPSNISYDLDINTIENKEYTVTYIANSNGKNIVGTRKIRFINTDIKEIFLYTGEEQVFSVNSNGSYKIELWGAQGGTMKGNGVDEKGISRGNLTYTGGKGAYTSGIISLSSGKDLYVYVGGKGSDNAEFSCIDGDVGGYNGGSSLISGQCVYGSSGGGATDVRLVNGSWDNFDGLKSRIMVAAGGGGANFRNLGYGEGNGGAGGALVGIDGESVNHTNGYGYGISTGATQIAGGVRHWYAGIANNPYSPEVTIGLFGQASNVLDQNGGGSGYYGSANSSHGGAGGGSSFISGYDGCDAIAESSTSDNIIHTGQSIHYSGYKFENSIMIAGNESMPEYIGNDTMVGNTGDGYAKISLIYYY